MSRREGACMVARCRADGEVGLVLEEPEAVTLHQLAGSAPDAVAQVCLKHGHLLGRVLPLGTGELMEPFCFLESDKAHGWRLHITLAEKECTIYPPGIEIPEKPYRP